MQYSFTQLQEELGLQGTSKNIITCNYLVEGITFQKEISIGNVILVFIKLT